MILDDARTWEELVWREFSVRYPQGIREGQILIASDSGKRLELSEAGTINQEGARQNVRTWEVPVPGCETMAAC